MHILIDLQACQTLGSRNRGIGRYSLALARAMAGVAAGTHRVSVLLSDRFPDTVAGLRDVFSPLVGAASIHTISLPAGCHYLDPSNFTRLRIAERIRAHAIRQINPDIVHVSSLFEGLGDDAVISIEPSADAMQRVAVTLYDLIPYLHQAVYLANPATRHWYYRRLQALRNADLLLAISESSRQEAIAALGIDARQVVNMSSAIDEHFVPVDITPDEQRMLCRRFGIARDFVLYTGGIDYRKNVEGLIRAYAMLPADLRMHHQLVIVCSINPDDERRLHEEARYRGMLPDELVLTGYVPEPDLVRLYNLAKLFVFPSLHEGFGLPVLEAMACGTPAIGADRSSIPEVIGRADALFDPTSQQAITAAIVHALRDDAFRQQLGRHGLERARQFSWQATARRALEAFQAIAPPPAARADIAPSVVSVPRQRLAYFSPLPNERSGIADYSAELLPELARHYEIELVTDATPLDEGWLQANFPVRSTEWFQRHADHYDRVLYHIGNSQFHVHMLPLLRRHPGVVMLHDYFLSGMLRYAETFGHEVHAFRNSLFRTHGYAALVDLAQRDAMALEMDYAANRSILDFAFGVLVHSRYSIELAERDYGSRYAARFAYVPFARRAVSTPSRAEARTRLGLDADAFVVCAFGFMAPTKLNLELIQAWQGSALSSHPQAQLVFVGQHPSEGYGMQVEAARRGSGSAIRITGFVSPADYSLWLAAADVGVQLRAQSRGETSAAIFDCLAYRLPVVFNAHGSAAELPDDVAIKLPDRLHIAALAHALERLFDDPALRADLARRGHDFVCQQHAPRLAARCYADAIESFYRNAPMASESQLLSDIANLDAGPSLSPDECTEIAACIARNRLDTRPPRLLLDITGVSPTLLRQWLPEFVRQLPTPWLMECVERVDSAWRTNRASVCAALGLPDGLPEEPLLPGHQDAWLTLSGSQPELPLPGLFAHRAARLENSQSSCPVLHIVRAIVGWLQSPGTFPPPLRPFGLSQT